LPTETRQRPPSADCMVRTEPPAAARPSSRPPAPSRAQGATTPERSLPPSRIAFGP
jgi:hypothetical protein